MIIGIFIETLCQKQFVVKLGGGQSSWPQSQLTIVSMDGVDTKLEGGQATWPKLQLTIVCIAYTLYILHKIWGIAFA